MSVDAAAEEQFGPYLVYERLGVGGMATVHRALEQGTEGFERMVALKRLLPHLAEDASFIKSFVREAKLASILSHVNIVQIYELGRVGTEYFISMEYIDGRDLRRILRHARKVTGPPPLHITVGLMIQLCEALDYAHTKVDEDGHPLGLVHRDISPSNLIVTSAGHLKIIDFGIAKAQSSQLRTQTGRVKGKLAYMAPEAISGSRDLDARSDIWATGVIIHELLTARPLFASKNEYQTLLKVQRGDIMPPSTFNQACTPELDAIVFRALARNADERYASAAELREALIGLKHQYGLQTSHRDIASWLDWAFGLEPPASFSANPDSSGVSAPQTPPHARAMTPRPARTTDEDEAVEVVWGGGNVESEDGPVVLEDVPDVSGKHRMRRDTESEADQVDDIPTPPPSHGTLPSIYGSDPHAPAPPVARGTDQMHAQRGTSGPHTISRAVTGPQPRGATGTHPVPRTARTTSQGVVVSPQPRTGPVPLDVPVLDDRLAAQRARDSEPPPDRPRTRSDSGAQTNPEAQRLRTEPEGLSSEDLFGRDAAVALAQVEGSMAAMSTLPAMPQQDDDEPTLEPNARAVSELPVVRFSRASSVPPITQTAALADPVRALPLPPTRTGPTPAPSAALRAPSPSKPPIDIRIGESIVARAAPRRTWLYTLVGLLLAGGAATGITLILTRGDALPEAATSATPPAPVRDTGTVKFVTEPADAEIRIGDDAAHAGSPWSRELPAGVHPIEIRRTGYKSWLTSIELSANETQTLRVVLEPMTATVADATLTIASTPAGLEVVIDGEVQAQRTPFKATIKVGNHEITLRQDGAEVWRQNLEAEAASDYEFNPSFSADKQRERAQRARRPSPVDRAAVKGDHQDPSPAWIKPAGTHTPADPPTAVPAAVTPGERPPATSLTPGGAKQPSVATQPPKPATPAPPAAKPQITAKPAAPAAPARPRLVAPKIVPPNAVKKLSGGTPSIERFKNDELPSTLAAKVCIDTTGKINFADMVTRVERRVAEDLTEQLRRWRYAPYLQHGVAIPACFVVTFRAK